MDTKELQDAIAIQAEIKKSVAQILSPEALKRISNVRAAKPEFALQIELYLIQAYKAGQLKAPVSDEQLRNILSSIVEKRSTKIIRK